MAHLDHVVIHEQASLLERVRDNFVTGALQEGVGSHGLAYSAAREVFMEDAAGPS